MIELVVLGPQPFDDGEPFLGHVVALVVRQHLDAEHIDLRLVPAGDDVEDHAAVGNMVDDGALLRGDDRMVDRAMRGGDHADGLVEAAIPAAQV